MKTNHKERKQKEGVLFQRDLQDLRNCDTRYAYDGAAHDTGLRRVQEQPQLYHGRRAGPGPQLRRIRGGDHTRRPHVAGPGAVRGRTQPGPGIYGHDALHCRAAGFQGCAARPGQRVYHTPEGHLAAHDNRRQGAGTCCTGDNEPDLGADVPASGHILPVSGHGPDTQLAAGQA